jgi:hypothetical protein
MAAMLGISAVAVQRIAQLSEFVDDAQNNATKVQALANELASFYACLGDVKLIITGPRRTPVQEEFNRDFAPMIRSNETTLKELQNIIDKAKKADSDRIATRVWKTVKFTFKTKQVDALRKRIQAENEVLGR